MFIDTPARHQSIALVLQCVISNDKCSGFVGKGMLVRVANKTINEVTPQRMKVWGVHLCLGARWDHFGVGDQGHNNRTGLRSRFDSQIASISDRAEVRSSSLLREPSRICTFPQSPDWMKA